MAGSGVWAQRHRPGLAFRRARAGITEHLVSIAASVLIMAHHRQLHNCADAFRGVIMFLRLGWVVGQVWTIPCGAGLLRPL